MGLPRSAAATLACALLLAACSSDPQPKFEDTPSPSPSVTSASPVEESSSEAPVALTPEETVRAWVDARNDALQDGDIDAVQALSTPSCRTCKDSYLPIVQIYESGGHYETSGWKVVAAKAKSTSLAKSVVNAGLEYDAGKTVPSAGAAPVTYEVEKHIATFRLLQDGGTWRVQFIGYLS